MNNGRFSSVETYVMTVIAPWMRPAAPTPATARPRMNSADDGAAAHSVDPADTSQDPRVCLQFAADQPSNITMAPR